MAQRQVGCSVEATISVIGGTWKPLILYHLLAGTRRFGEPRRLVLEATQQMLTLQLREPKCDGLVHREVDRQVPPKVEYSLTPRGWSLEPILPRMNDWGPRVLAETAAAATLTADGEGNPVPRGPSSVAGR